MARTVSRLWKSPSSVAHHDPIRIRPYQDGDETGILDCYDRIFPVPGGSIPERSLEHWRWKFRDNPTGLIHVVVADHEKEGIVGAYPTLPVRVWTEGREALAAQVVDLMVLPSWRRHGPRPGLFVALGRDHYRRYGGAEPGKELFHYGWPVPAWAMGQKYLDYWNVRGWDFLFKEGLAGSSCEIPGELEVRAVDRYGSDADSLFESLKPTMEMALVRDSKYLNWRYADHTDRSYVLFECREKGSGELRGLSVYTVGDLIRPNTGFVVDWLVPAEDHVATAALMGAAEGRAEKDGVSVLAVLFNQVDPRFRTFQDLGYRVMGTSYFVVVASFKQRLTYFRESWYYTMGDSDLI